MSGAYRKAFWISAAGFALVSAAAGSGLAHGVDLWALQTLQRPASPALDLVAEAVSVTGGITLTTTLALALAAVLYARGARSLALRLLAALAAITVVEVVLKVFLSVPPLPLENLRSVGDEFILSLPHPYPSGHMMRTVFLAGAAALLAPRRAVLLAGGIWVAAMAVTRVYLGVHWASDVAGGALLAVAGLAWAFWTRKGEYEKKRDG